jgi:hypothetical protein
MPTPLNVVIVLGRCRTSRQMFGMRYEEQSRGVWAADWAFPVKEQTAKRERFDRSEIRGKLEFAKEYPGCPSCGSAGAFKCSCGKVGCWDTESKRVKCPWCNDSITLDGVVDRLSAGGDL